MGKRIWKWIGGLSVSLVLAGGIAYAAAPGYHRALTPGLFGMTKAADNLYIDNAELADMARDLITQSEVTTQAFFGELRANPVFIICSTQDCKTQFGLRSRGLSLGYQVILIDHIDNSALIHTHERIHAELHRFMGITDIWDQRFPAWFDEGLASHISGDTRLNRPQDARDAD